MSQPTWAPCANCTTPETCSKSTGGCLAYGVGQTYTISTARLQAGTISEARSRLRWLERWQQVDHWNHKSLVLQQQWRVTDLSTGHVTDEWRDVPTETE